MGVVYAARDRSTGEQVAVKVLTLDGEHDRRRFARETRVLAEVRHHGIIRYVDHGETPAGLRYLAMEWVEGETLAERLTRSGLSAREAVEVIRRIADALGEAHRMGILHRDLKPSNVMLPNKEIERVKLLDFGLARHAARTDVSMTGVLVGTPNYMAPEQAEGSRIIDARADVFALGCLLYKCLTNETPFAATDFNTVLARLLFSRAPRVRAKRPELPVELDALVARMLEKEPARRPANGSEVATLLAMLPALDVPMNAVPARAQAITASEQRLVALVVAGEVDEADADDPTVVLADPASRSNAPLLRTTIAAHGGAAERVGEDGLIASFAGAKSATDLALQAARCALAIRAIWPKTPVAVGIGWIAAQRRRRGSDLFTQTKMLLEPASAPMSARTLTTPGVTRRIPVMVDEMTSNLLDARFEVHRIGPLRALSGERELMGSARTLLGRPTPCVGRDRELAAIDGLWRECVTESVARFMLVTGPAGAGKSRLRYEFLQRLRDEGDDSEVWIARGDPTRKHAPFGLIGPLIRRVAGIVDGEPLEARQQKFRARVGRHVPPKNRERVTEFLAEIAGIPLGDGSDAHLLNTARQNTAVMGDQQRRAFEEWLVAECTASPVLIVIEDLQWGDVPSMKLVEAALRNLSDRPFLVLSFARPEVSESFPGLLRDYNAQELALPALPRRAAERLVDATLGDRVNAERRAQMIELAQGNVFYLEELIRSVAEGRGDELPGTVVAMVQSRVDELDAELRRVLRAASVFGRVSWRGGLIALLGGREKARIVDDLINELIDRELLSERDDARFPAERELAFRHGVMRDAVYALLSPEDRALAHRLAAGWLEAVGEENARVLAEHHALGEEPALAARWYELAAHQALEGNDYAATIDCVERATACGIEGERLGALKLLQAEAHKFRGEVADGVRVGFEAKELLAERSATWFNVVGELAQGVNRLRQPEVLDGLAAEMAAAAGSGAQSPEFMMASATLAVQLASAGRLSFARTIRDHLEAAFALAPPSGLVAGWVCRARSYIALFEGDAWTYLRESEAAREHFTSAGALRLAAGLRTAVGYAAMTLGRYEEAERELRDALKESQRLGIAAQITNIKHNLGLTVARLGRLDEGLALELEAATECVAQGDKRIEEGVRAYLAEIYYTLGDDEATYREAARSYEVGGEPAKALALAWMAEAKLAMGKNEEALELSGRAVGIFESVRGIEEGAMRVRLVRVKALRAAGATSEALAALDIALRELGERLARITDASARKSSLERLPENLEALRIAREFGREPPAIA